MAKRKGTTAVRPSKQEWRDALQVSMIKQQIVKHEKLNPGENCWTKLGCALIVQDLAAKGLSATMQQVDDAWQDLYAPKGP